MKNIDIFNKYFNSKGCEGFFETVRYQKPTSLSIKSLRILCIDLYFHNKKENKVIKTFELKGMIPSDKIAEFYNTLEDEVSYYLLSERDNLLQYGIQ